MTMKKIDDKDLERLLERFMDGETSNAEEQLIYERFRSGDIPECCRQYAPMMVWLADKTQSDEETPAVPPFKRFATVKLWLSIAAAVMVVATLAIGLFMRPTRTLPDEDYITYAGSYVIKNGVKYTDLDEIMPELLEAEQLVEQQQHTAADIISSLEGVINTSDPAVRAALESAFSE